MEYGQSVRVVNVSSSESPKLKQGFLNSKYPTIPGNGSKITSWGNACLWLGDPSVDGAGTAMEETRVRAFYGCAIEDSQIESHLPDFEVYDLETGDRILTVCDRLRGVDMGDSQAGEPAEDQQFIITELRRLKTENENFARQLAAVQAGKSVRSADLVAPADESEPAPQGVTSADAPQMAKAGPRTK